VKLNRHSLRAWMHEREFTQAQLATACGVDRTLVSKILAGERTASPSFIACAASELRVRKVVLLADPNEEDSDSDTQEGVRV